MKVLTYTGSGAAVDLFNTKVEPFDDVRVRQALVMALDRKKMVGGHHRRHEPSGVEPLWRWFMGQVQG